MTSSRVSGRPSSALTAPLELLTLNHLLINWFTIEMGDRGHALVGPNVLWILRFVTTASGSSFPVLAISIAISLALSILLLVSRLVARSLGWSRELGQVTIGCRDSFGIGWIAGRRPSDASGYHLSLVFVQGKVQNVPPTKFQLLHVAGSDPRWSRNAQFATIGLSFFRHFCSNSRSFQYNLCVFF